MLVSAHTSSIDKKVLSVVLSKEHAQSESNCTLQEILSGQVAYALSMVHPVASHCSTGKAMSAPTSLGFIKHSNAVTIHNPTISCSMGGRRLSSRKTCILLVLRSAAVIRRIFFVIGQLYLIRLWFGEDQTTNSIRKIV